MLSSPNSSILSNPDRSPNRSYHSATAPTLNTSQSSPSSFSATQSNQSTYVVVEILEAKAERLLLLLQERVIHTNVDSVLDYDELADLVPSTLLSSLPLIVRYLEAQKKILVDENSIAGKRIVKFTLNSSRHVAGNISEIEFAFFKVCIFLFPQIE